MYGCVFVTVTMSYLNDDAYQCSLKSIINWDEYENTIMNDEEEDDDCLEYFQNLS